MATRVFFFTSGGGGLEASLDSLAEAEAPAMIARSLRGGDCWISNAIAVPSIDKPKMPPKIAVILGDRCIGLGERGMPGGPRSPSSGRGTSPRPPIGYGVPNPDRGAAG